MRKKHHVWNEFPKSIPDLRKLVHVWGEDIGQHIAWHDGDRWIDYIHDPFDISSITHWIYFPKPPKG